MNREIKERTKWFMDARFGMFIHWGLYSIPACGEWVMSQKEMTIEEYRKYFEQFDPVDYDPKTWVRLAKEAGMKYVVLTAKHHDGFCLFDSKLTDYKATNTKAGLDLVREFVDACREEGLKVGLYFSIIDWHHPDFPKYGDRQHPMRNNAAYKDEKIDFDRYLDYMHGQVKELVTNYGKLDLLWFDFSYDDMTGEKWKATDLIKMVRHYQPDVIIDNRLEGAGDNHGSIATEHPLIYSGDFASPEQIIPPKGVCDVNGEPIPWELCATMNNHWGYCNFDHQYKTPEMLVRKLVECVSKGGNMILNVGPDAKGNIPKESVEILKEVGNWMDKNKESIYGCGISDLEKPDWGRYTEKDGVIYAHVYETPLGALPLYGISPEKLDRITYLADGSEVKEGEAWNTALYIRCCIRIIWRLIRYLLILLPDEKDNGIKNSTLRIENEEGRKTMKQVTSILIGAGLRGGYVYSQYALDHPDEFKVVAVAEPDQERRELFAAKHNIPKELQYESYEELLQQDKIADCAMICTQDKMHYEPVTMALQKGYHVLCEKPMSPNKETKL